MDKNMTAPIKTKAQIDAMAKALYNFDPTFHALFLLMLETGIKFNEARTIKVKELKGKNEITYTRHGKSYTFPIGRPLKNTLKELANGKEQDEYLFVGSRSGKPILQQSYYKALTRSSGICGINPPVSAMSLTKTFVLGLMKDNFTAALEFTGIRTRAQLYEYLQLEPPKDRAEMLTLHTTKQAFFDSKILVTVHTKVHQTLDDIQKQADAFDETDNAFFTEAQQYLYDLDHLTDKYNNGGYSDGSDTASAS